MRSSARCGCVYKGDHEHKSGTAAPEQRWPEAPKREIVAATLRPGASVSVVARQYDVNANQVFSWRRRYGEAEKPAAAPPSTSGLVPVMIAPIGRSSGAYACRSALAAQLQSSKSSSTAYVRAELRAKIVAAHGRCS
jgi:transposase-like protein